MTFPAVVLRDCGLIAIRCDRLQLFDRLVCRAVRDIHARELERPSVVVAAAGVEVRSMVRKSQQMSSEQLFEARPCGVKPPRALFEPSLRVQHISKSPPDLWIAARQRWHE